MKEVAMESKIFKVSSFLAMRGKIVGNKSGNNKFAGDRLYYHFTTNDNMLTVMFTLRGKELDVGISQIPKGKIRLILGDDSEWESTQGNSCMGGGVYIELDLDKGYIEIKTSILGLPPVFFYEGSDGVIVTSDLYLIPEVTGLSLRLDPMGVKEMADIGYPLEHRTLFRDVRWAHGGHSIKLMKDRPLVIGKAWAFPAVEPLESWGEYIDMQIDTFKHAMGQFDLSSTFLSLTGGLDTRAVLASIIETNRLLPAYTISGTSLTVDAKIAKDLASAYNMPYQIVELGKEFCQNLPTYVEQSSFLSGGISSFELAHEVYFYSKIDQAPLARLSGIFGTQLARSGTSGISLKNTDISVLDKDFIAGYEVGRGDLRFKNANIRGGCPEFEFLLQEEVPLSAIANYCIGNHFAIQKTPYASRTLIEAHRYHPQEVNEDNSLSILRMRLKDLRHRFFGDKEARSFQRKLIREVGGYGAVCPINWGWRANGGISPSGFVWGLKAFIDAVAGSKGLNSGVTSRLLTTMGISGVQDFRQFDLWFKQHLKDFVFDLLTSPSVSTCGLFNIKRLNEMLNEHYSSKKSHYRALVLALNLALAQKLFKTGI